MTERPLEGQVALVTGAGRGIGRELARWLAAAGADVALVARSGAELEAVAGELRTSSGVATSVQVADVADALDVQRAVDAAVASLGRLDLAIANAGVLGPVGVLAATDPHRWIDTLRVNVGGTANVVRACVPAMVAAGGGHLLTLSGAGLGGPALPARLSAYVASKAAVVAFTEAMAAELPPGVTINAVAPGAVPTGFMAEVLAQGPDGAGAELHAAVAATPAPDLGPLRRLVLFLVGDGAAHLSGRCFSARWDDPAVLASLSEAELGRSRFRLRRIDEDLFHDHLAGTAGPA